MRKLTDFSIKERLKICELYKKGCKSCPKLGKIFNTGSWTIIQILKDAGIERFIGKLSKSQKDELILDYITNKKSLSYYSDKYKIQIPNIISLLKTREIKTNGYCGNNRKYKLDENYFKKIDTEEKAYFLGFMYADGCNNGYGFHIGLQERDSYILEKFKMAISYNGKLHFCNLKKKNKNHQNQYRLTVYSPKMSSDLKNLGCFPRKSLKLRYPTIEQVPEYLHNHFIRGYLDGDGCIGLTLSKNRKGQIRRQFVVTFISTSMFLSKMKKIIVNNTLYSNIQLNKCNYKNNNITSYLRIKGRTGCLKVLDWLYSNATIYIERKYLKYQEIKATINNSKIAYSND